MDGKWMANGWQIENFQVSGSFVGALGQITSPRRRSTEMNRFVETDVGQEESRPDRPDLR
jgi:hypothetical protein